MSITYLARLVRSRSVILWLCPSAMCSVPEPNVLGHSHFSFLSCSVDKPRTISRRVRRHGQRCSPGDVQVAHRRQPGRSAFCFLFPCRTARHASPPHWSETHRRLGHLGGQSSLRNSGYSGGVSVYLCLLKNIVCTLMLLFIQIVWENVGESHKRSSAFFSLR